VRQTMQTQLIRNLEDQHVDQLFQLYQQEWWTKDRQFDDVVRMLQHSSLVFGLTDKQDRLVAFCRVLSDFVYRATIYDVIVDQAFRGQGLARTLLDTVFSDPQLTQISTLWLCCNPDKFELYAKWGFVVFDEGQQWMIKAQGPG